jgi:opacity protein-like surface antigen
VKSGIKSLAACLAVVAVLGMASESFGQVVPFNGKGRNATYDVNALALGANGTGDFSGTGQMTQLGLCSVSGNAVVEEPLDGTELLWSVDFPKGAVIANKHGTITLEQTGNASVEFIPIAGGLFTATWSVDFSVTGGTGKYAGAGAPAPLKVSAVNDPFQLGQAELTYSWTIEGAINLPRGKK